MNKALLPIMSRLASLAEPARVAPGGSRVIADLTHPNPLAALLREVNETILERSLFLESSGGSSLTLDVAGRRVLRVIEATGLVGAERCLAAGTLEDEYKDELLDLMKGVAVARHELRVTSRPIAQSVEGLSVGLPVALLADLMLIDLNEAPADARPAPAPVPEEPRLRRPAPVVVASIAPVEVKPAPRASLDLQRLASAMGPSLVAWLVKGGADDGASGGPEEMLAPLWSFIGDESDAVLTQIERVATRQGGPICLVLGATLVDGHSVIAASSGLGLLLGVVEGDGTQQLLQAWAEALPDAAG